MDEQTPVNEDPEYLVSAVRYVLDPIEKYGWFILLGLLVILYIWKKVSPYLMKRWKEYQENMEQQKLDPERVWSQQQAMDMSRARLQEIQNALSERYKEQQQLLEEQKRRQKIEDWDRHLEGRGYRSKIKKPEDSPPSGNEAPKRKPKKPLRQNNFNPLMGSYSGPSYRPDRRGGAGGAGGG